MKLQEQTLKKIRSIRVKVIELHSMKPLAVVGLYNGYLQTWNTLTLQLVNEVQVTEFPIRSVALVEKNNCVLIGSDDGRLYVYELNNLQRLSAFDAHDDFIRKIVVNSMNTEFLTCSDDSTIKLWEIGTVMKCVSVFTGHTHFVMDVCYNPKDTKQFISCSLDGTIKLWNIESKTAIKTYKGHKSGINTLSFCKDCSYFISGSDDLSLKIWDISTGNCISTLSGHTNNILNVFSMTKLPYIVSCSEDGTYRLWDENSFENVEIINLNSGRIWQFKECKNNIVIGTDEELIFKKIQTGNNLHDFKNHKLYFTSQNCIYSCKSDEIYNIKKIAELDFYPSELCVSENSKSIAICDDKNFYVHSSLGFRKKINGSGTNLHFVNNEEFFVLRKNYADLYKKNEIVRSLKLEDVERILFVDRYIYTRTGKSTEVFTLEGTKIFSWNYLVKKVLVYKSYVILHLDNKIQLYRVEDEIITAYIEQDLEIDEKGIPDSFIFLNEFNVNIESSCVQDNLLIFSYENRGYYIFLQDKPFLYSFGQINGSICGSYDYKLLVLDNKKVNYVDLDMEFIQFQLKVLSNEQANCKEAFRIKAISFYESLGKNDEALAICANDNQKFEILLKLGRLNDACKIAVTPIMFDRLGSEFLKSYDLVNATECFYKSKNWKSLLFVDLLCNKKYLKEIAENSLKNGENNVAFISLMKIKDYAKCGNLLKDTKFYNIFKKTYLE